MSVQSIQNSIQTCRKNIQSLNDKMTREMQNEHDKTRRIGQINSGINKYTSQSQINNYNQELQRLQREIGDVQKRKADISRDVSRETEKLHKYEADLHKEQERDNKKFQDELKRQTESFKFEQKKLAQRLADLADSPQQTSLYTTKHMVDDAEYDFFISHASEDKEEVVRPLAEKLRDAGYKVWYDEFRLKVGDSLRKSIDLGLSKSKYGIVVLSPSFFAKNWPEYELNGMVAREMQGGKVVLPLWHKVTKSEVISYSPTLADKLALNTALNTIDEIVNQLVGVLNDS